MGLELTDAAKKYLATKGYDPVLGARPLRRTIQRDIEDTLSEQILFNELRPGQIVVVDCEGDPTKIEKSKLTFTGAETGSNVPDAVPADLGGADHGRRGVGAPAARPGCASSRAVVQGLDGVGRPDRRTGRRAARPDRR